MSANPAEDKKNAIAFYDLMFNSCQPRQAIERFVGDDYILHHSASQSAAEQASIHGIPVSFFKSLGVCGRRSRQA